MRWPTIYLADAKPVLAKLQQFVATQQLSSRWLAIGPSRTVMNAVLSIGATTWQSEPAEVHGLELL